MSNIEAAVDAYTVAVTAGDAEEAKTARLRLMFAIEDYAVEASQDKIDAAIQEYKEDEAMDALVRSRLGLSD